MSPIIKEPDGPEPVPLNIENGATPFPEDINAGSNALQATNLPSPKPSDSADKKSKQENNGVTVDANVSNNSDRKKSAPNTPKVTKKGTKSVDKKPSDLKRSQSFRTGSKANASKNENQKPALEAPEQVSVEKGQVAPLSKQNKLGRFQMFKNRFAVFPKSSGNEENESSFHNLRRSQSMRIPIKKSSLAFTSNNQLNPFKVMHESIHEDVKPKDCKSRSRDAIKNSKSLTDVRHFHKKVVNHSSQASSQNVALNNAVKRTPNNINSRVTTLTSKIRNSSEVLTSEKGTNKTFAHKTIDVIRKSVQSKFKVNVEKRDKKKADPVSPPPKTKSPIIDSSRKKLVKTVTNSSKDLVKMNSKRKKNEGNDSDSEFKPKKKTSSNPKEKTNSEFKEKASKENRISSLSSKSKDKPKEKQYNLDPAKTLNNKNKDKSVLKINNKKMKGNKTTILNMKNNNEKVTNVDNLNANNNSSKLLNDNKNIIYSSIEPKSCQSPPVSEIQSHHALFLNNIHETLNNSCKKKHDNIPSKNLNLNLEKPFGETKLTETLNQNIYEIISSRFSNSLPFILAEFDVKSDEITNVETEESNLTKSYSETCISERSLTMSVHEVDMKSMSPMSISNYDDERSKTDLQSPMSFTNYDPYIDESMDDYWCEGEEESYFGTLFTESKLIWDSFAENFNDIDVELGNDSFYLDDIILNNRECNEIAINANLSIDSNHFENMRHDSSTPTVLNNCLGAAIENIDKNADSFNISEADYSERDLNTLLASHKILKTNKEKSYDITKARLAHQILLDKGNRPSITELRDKVDITVTSPEIQTKLSPNKTVTSKKSLIESKTKRKNLKNILKPNSTTRIKKIKEMVKPNTASDLKLTPILKNENIKKKALSETCIINKETSLRKEKSELECRRKQGTEKEEDKKDESAKSLCTSSHIQNEEAKKNLKTNAKNDDEKKRQEASAGRRSKIDTTKMTLSKPLRIGPTRTKQTDPVKVLRPAVPNGQPPSQAPHQICDQLKKLEAELSARTQEAKSAKEEATRTNRGVEALTVLVHHLTKEYDAFSAPKFKAEAKRLTSQLTDVRLCLDESTANARRLENEATERCETQANEIRELQKVHRQEISSISFDHQIKTEQALEKHQLELKELIVKEETKHDEIIKCHKEELERIDNDWRRLMDKQHERHLQALEQLNTCHTQQLRDAQASWDSREKEILETNARLLKEQSSLKQQAKKLEETLLGDKDHRLQAARRLCTALQNEVDSLKTVVEMRNSEVHKLRDQLANKERIGEDLDVARDRVRALQAKTEDLHAQMEKKLQLERQLIADHHSISDSLQREASISKRLTLDNEELIWKLRQREAACGSLPTSTLE